MHWPVGQTTDAADFLRRLDSLGIDHGIVCGLEILHKLGQAPHWNDLLAEMCSRGAGRLTALATVHLVEGDAAISEARRCVEKLGVKGFKAHPWSQGESVLQPTMYKLCDLAAEHDLPILFHDGTPSNSLPSQIAVLAGAKPKTKLILGHGGLLHLWDDALESVRQHANVYIVLCGQHPWAMQAICDHADEARIMWGTDYVGPGTEAIVTYRKGLADLLTISPAKRTAVMGANAQRLFNISNR
jgi:uncharacterized protein